MTEPIDTALIRAIYDPWHDNAAASANTAEVIHRLCDALDAAQARADDLAAELAAARDAYRKAHALAERTHEAEARAAAAEARVEKAENQARSWRIRAEKNDEISQRQKARAEAAEDEVAALRELEGLQRLSLHMAETKNLQLRQNAIQNGELVTQIADERDAARAQVAAVRALAARDNPHLGHQGCVQIGDLLAALDSAGDPKNFLADLEPPKYDEVERRPGSRRTPWAQVRRKSAGDRPVEEDDL